MIRVVVAEDSPTARTLLVEILHSDPDIQVVGEAVNGAEAIELADSLRPDLMTMDVHMPGIDGIEATQEIMMRSPTPILIVSSVGGREAELSFNAIQAGALMVLAKPESALSDRFEGQKDELLRMAKAMARVKVVRRWSRVNQRAPAANGRHANGARIRLVAVAASTGGPAAVQTLLAGFPPDFVAPVVIVQHIAQGFVAGLADWLSASCGFPVKVAENGEPLMKRTAYLAPDDRHLGVTREGRLTVVTGPEIDGFRPSGTYLFDSVAKAYGTSATAVILTGMGSDGVEGLRRVKAAGGHVFAQDRASCVVFGMPGEAVAAGVVDAVLPAGDIAARVTELVRGRE
jgi:two-component system, chemotaxis family, protein-glutamate methylesterase/glutaminase